MIRLLAVLLLLVSTLQAELWMGHVTNGNYATSDVFNFAIDSSGDYFGSTFYARNTSAITTAYVYVDGITGTSPTYKAVLEQYDGSSTGQPDGVDLGGGSPTAKDFTPSGTGWQTITFTNSYTPTQGEYIALVIRYSSGTVDAGNNCDFAAYNARKAFSYDYLSTRPFTLTSEKNGLPYATAQAADGTTYGYAAGGPSYEYYDMDTGTTPDEAGIKITLPSACSTLTLRSVRYQYMGVATASDFDVKIYDTDGSTVLTTKSVVHGWGGSNGPAKQGMTVLSANQTLTCGSTYRVTLLPTTTYNVWLYYASYINTSVKDNEWVYGPSDVVIVGTVRTDAGSWTDSDTDVPFIELGFSDMTAPGAGAGGGGTGCIVF